MMRSVLPALQEEQTEKVEDHIFRIYDINNDGIVSFHEFMTVFMILTGRNREVYVVNLNFLTIEINILASRSSEVSAGDDPRTVLGKMFLIFDVDNSGLITKVCTPLDLSIQNEFCQDNMLTLVTDLHKLFVEREETDEDLATKAFEEMDTDENGSVTKEEFIDAILGQEKFSTYLTLKIYNLFE